MAEQWLEGVNPKTIKGEKMKTRITLWIVIGVLFVITAIWPIHSSHSNQIVS